MDIFLLSTAQCLATLRRFDITIAVSTLSSYRVVPEKGHTECMK